LGALGVAVLAPGMLEAVGVLVPAPGAAGTAAFAAGEVTVAPAGAPALVPAPLVGCALAAGVVAGALVVASGVVVLTKSPPEAGPAGPVTCGGGSGRCVAASAVSAHCGCRNLPRWQLQAQHPAST
jgi:hypothetical protein